MRTLEILEYNGTGQAWQQIDMGAQVETAFVSIVQGAVRSAGISLSDISAAGVSSQAQTFTIADGLGLPKVPFISWLDQRAVKSCKEMKQEEVFADFADKPSCGRRGRENTAE